MLSQKDEYNLYKIGCDINQSNMSYQHDIKLQTEFQDDERLRWFPDTLDANHIRQEKCVVM